ncbi:tail tubular protein A [Xanthomonas phage SB3]|uniref:Tail tubular protein A n=1 Tax=Xanthomonas phage SB3 TaxID=3117472 RepID=A0ABZ2GZH5_9CAUD
MHVDKLTVVNQCLATKGILPLSTLEDDHPDRDAALLKLDEFNLNIQSHDNGWWFNTEYIQMLPEAGTGFIYVPHDAIEFHPSATRGLVIGQRGRRLYHSADNSYKFTTPVSARIVRLLDFEDLPYLAQYAVQTATVADYQYNYDADQQRAANMANKAAVALGRLKAQDTRQKRPNLLHTHGMARFMADARMPHLIIPSPTRE